MKIGVRIAGIGGQFGRIEIIRLRERILAQRLRRPGSASLVADRNLNEGSPGSISRTGPGSQRPRSQRTQ